MSEYAICVECQTKFNDTSIKLVVPCPVCKRIVCSIHSQPMLAHIPDFRHTGKAIREAKKIIENHNAGGLGHSCLPYTMDFWKKFDLEKELKRQRLRNQMDGFGYVTDEEIERTSDRSLEEIQKKLSAINSALKNEKVEIPVTDEGKKPKESLWDKFKKH